MMLSLIIPCYNEGKNLPLLIERCRSLCSHGDIEVILVDNGSKDNTPEVLAELLSKDTACRSVRVDVNQGYGYGILAGLKSAKGNILAWTHADMQTDPIDLIEGKRLFEAHGASTFVKGKRYGRPWSDTVFTMGMSFFEMLLLRKFFWDINAQPNIFSKDFFESWTNPPHDFSLDLFVYFEAKRQDLRVVRYPVLFGKRAHGVSHWNIDWKSKIKFIKRTMEFSFTLKKRYK
jgi:glycosyltransferase involved in cell wall biosynthesis